MPKATNGAVLTGTIKRWNQDRGFGFITTADARDIFAHITQVADKRADPVKGDRVNFIEDIGKDGRAYARNIVVVKENESV